MTRGLRRRVVLASSLAVLFLCGACNKAKDQAESGPAGVGPGPSTPIKEIMTKLTKGPGSLTPVISQELNTDPPPWDTIQTQTKEFAQLAASMGKYDPPKGSKDSWATLTSAYSEAAASLDKAAQAKDKNAALEAHKTLANSCMSCHQAHRGMGPGMGMPGKGPPGGPPK
jgi:hypothetical protein